MAVFKKNEIVKQDTFPRVSSMPIEKTNSFIGKNLFVKGELSSDEEVLIEGKIEGKLNVRHKVIIGKNGTVNADIDAREVIIIGTVNGNVTCSYKIEIVAEGVLNGNIIARRVKMADGALFKGNIDMTPPEGKIPEDE
jgi:cytoskeletal protein CcmA (bactofilin family)